MTIGTPRLFLLGALALIGTMIAGCGLLIGGYHLSQWLLPHWPTDYHATFAIALMAIVMLIIAGVAAMRGNKR